MGGKIQRTLKPTDSVQIVKLEALYIYELPKNSDKINDCFILYHRRFSIQDVAFQKCLEKHPIIFGHPVLVSKRVENVDELYEKVSILVKRMLTKVPKYMNCAKDCDDSIGLEDFGFAISAVNRKGTWADLKSNSGKEKQTWLNFSRGTPINDANIQNWTFLAINWLPKAYSLRFIPGSDQHSIYKEIFETDITIEEVLEAHFASEIINESQLHKITISKAPNVLLIQLQRATFQDNQFGKRDTKIAFGKTLEIEEDSKTINYTLKAFCMHHGANMNSGHYVTVAKTGNNCWFMFNDSEVSRIKDEGFGEYFSSVYILAYEKDDGDFEMEENEILEDFGEDEVVARKIEIDRKLENELDRAVQKNCSIM